MATKQLKFGLSPTIMADFQTVFAEFPEVEKVLIFGSRSKNTWKDGSDIDLAVIGSKLSKDDFNKLWNKIDDLPIIFKIDCLHLEELSNLKLKEKILQEGKTFYPIKGI